MPTRSIAAALILAAGTGALSAQQETKELYGVRWFRSVPSAVHDAREKPILWLRTLGDLSGKL